MTQVKYNWQVAVLRSFTIQLSRRRFVPWFLSDFLTVSSGGSSGSGHLNGEVQDKCGPASNDFCSQDVLSLDGSEEVLSDCTGEVLPVEIGGIASFRVS